MEQPGNKILNGKRVVLVCVRDEALRTQLARDLKALAGAMPVDFEIATPPQAFDRLRNYPEGTVTAVIGERLFSMKKDDVSTFAITGTVEEAQKALRSGNSADREALTKRTLLNARYDSSMLLKAAQKAGAAMISISPSSAEKIDGMIDVPVQQYEGFLQGGNPNHPKTRELAGIIYPYIEKAINHGPHARPANVLVASAGSLDHPDINRLIFDNLQDGLGLNVKGKMLMSGSLHMTLTAKKPIDLLVITGEKDQPTAQMIHRQKAMQSVVPTILVGCGETVTAEMVSEALGKSANRTPAAAR